MNSAALATPHLMIVQSDLFGSLEVSPEEVISFPAGLFGFPDCRDFILLPAAREGMFWLQSADHGTLAFLLADPFRFFDGYVVDLTLGDRAELMVAAASDVVILAIVTLPRTPGDQPTANLQGPLAINLQSRRAKQLAVAESRFGLRAPIDLSAETV